MKPNPFKFSHFKSGLAAVTRSGRRVLWNNVDNGECADGSFFCVIDNVRENYLKDGTNTNLNKRMDLFMIKPVNVENLTQSEALHWLRMNDLEYDWVDTGEPGLIDAVCDNLSQYGESCQHGHIHATFDEVVAFTYSVFAKVEGSFTVLSPSFEEHSDAEKWLMANRDALNGVLDAVQCGVDVKWVVALTHNPSGCAECNYG